MAERRSDMLRWQCERRSHTTPEVHGGEVIWVLLERSSRLRPFPMFLSIDSILVFISSLWKRKEKRGIGFDYCQSDRAMEKFISFYIVTPVFLKVFIWRVFTFRCVWSGSWRNLEQGTGEFHRAPRHRLSLLRARRPGHAGSARSQRKRGRCNVFLEAFWLVDLLGGEGEGFMSKPFLRKPLWEWFEDCRVRKWDRI